MKSTADIYMTEERKTEIVNIRLSPGRKRLLQKAAATENRSVSNLIEHLLIKHCERQGLVNARPLKGRNSLRQSVE